jgi:hypothetical protein
MQLFPYRIGCFYSPCPILEETMPDPVRSTPRVAQPGGLPPYPVITLILLHLIFVLEIAVSNFKVLRLWFTDPSVRIQSFPVWSPIIEAQFILFTLCVLGLSAAKPWSWWLALFLNGYASLLHFFYFRYLFLRPFSFDIGLALIGYLLDAVAFLLLFFPSVLRHYTVDRFIARHPALQSAAARIEFPFVDKIMTRFIAAAQLIAVLLLFLRTIPYLGFIYFAPITIFGAVSARKLFTLRTRHRIACAVWQALLVVYYLFWSSRVTPDLVSSPFNRLDACLAAYSCLAILYLAASALYLRSQPAPLSRPLQIS